MMISTRGRYALRVMVDLAEHQKDGPIPLKDVAERLDISLKYLERIVPALAKSHFIEGTHGKGGGYRLTSPPESYKVGEILRLAEGDLVPVACAGCATTGNAPACEHMDTCRTRFLWDDLNTLVNNYFDGVTLSDLMKKEQA